MPSVWRSARRKKKRKHRDPQPGTPPPEGEVSEQGQEKKSGWIYEYALPPPPEQCLSDDEVHVSHSQQLVTCEFLFFTSLLFAVLDYYDGSSRVKVFTDLWGWRQGD